MTESAPKAIPTQLAEIGARLRLARKDRNLSLASVAGRANISAATLSRIENGKQPLGLELFLSLTGLLGITAQDVLADGGEPQALIAAPPRARDRKGVDARLAELVRQFEVLREKLAALRDDVAAPEDPADQN